MERLMDLHIKEEPYKGLSFEPHAAGIPDRLID
jgi:hypothetical protein